MGFIFWFGSLPPPYLVNSQVSPSILRLQHFSQHEHNAKLPIAIEIYTSPPLALRLLSTDLPPLGLALSLSLEYIPLLLFRESKHIVVKYYMYLTLIVYWIFVNGLSNWNSILLTSWKIGVSGNACFLGIFFFFVGLCSHLWWVGIWWCHLCWACFSCVGAMGRGFRRG